MKRISSVLVTAAVALLLCAAFVGCDEGDSVAKFRELTLRQDLYTFRAALDQYTADKHRRPQSLNDLIAAEYIKHIPVDPITKRSDTWVLEWSADANSPGIVNIRSGSRSVGRDGTAYSDW